MRGERGQDPDTPESVAQLKRERLVAALRRILRAPGLTCPVDSANAILKDPDAANIFVNGLVREAPVNGAGTLAKCS